MADLSNIPDDQLDAMIAAQNNAVSSAILGQESGNNPNSPSSVDGAVGMGQIEPSTFAQYAQPGEDINNPSDNLAVHKRIIADLSQKAGGDPARIAVGYFSGPGNIAPLGSPTPYIHDHHDGNGKYVSSYVSDVLSRMNPVSDAQASDAELPMPTGVQALSDEDLDKQIAALQGTDDDAIPNAQPTWKQKTADAFAKMSADSEAGLDRNPTNGKPSVLGQLHALGNAGKFLTDSATSGLASLLPQSVRDAATSGAANVVSAMRPAAQSVADALDNTAVGRAAGDTLLDEKSRPETKTDRAMSDIFNLASAPLMAENLIGLGQKALASGVAQNVANSSIINKLKSGVMNSPAGSFLADESSTSGPIASATKAAIDKTIPEIDPHTAAIVDDAAKLGVNIPPRIFNPGATSAVLNKAGLMKDGDVKSDFTTALSKVMGHSGTPNLDVGTMENIGDDIGSRMNDFALKADAAGGIPLDESALDTIADDSFADQPKVTKLVQKIKDRITNGTISGQDYQELTKKGGVLTKAMKSSDSDFADTASELRNHLDQQLQSTVSPSDLSDFQDARRQYRTMKIVEPLVESGGVSGQVDSGTKLFNAVKRNYGSMKNAVKYNPELGKLAQIANEFPEILKDSEKTSAVAKLAKAATVPSAIGLGAIGATPAAVVAGASVPAAYGVGKYLSSPGYKAAIMSKAGYKEGGVVEKRAAKIHEKHATALKSKLGREPKSSEIELAHYVGPHGVKRLHAQQDNDLPAHKMFSQETVAKNRDLFFNKRKPYTVGQIKAVL